MKINNNIKIYIQSSVTWRVGWYNSYNALCAAMFYSVGQFTSAIARGENNNNNNTFLRDSKAFSCRLRCYMTVLPTPRPRSNRDELVPSPLTPPNPLTPRRNNETGEKVVGDLVRPNGKTRERYEFPSDQFGFIFVQRTWPKSAGKLSRTLTLSKTDLIFPCSIRLI